MLMVEDINLNSIQGYPNSLEVLRQTMPSQEDIFREQVHELHRLYDIQRNLMADFERKPLDGYSYWREQAQPTMGWLTNPTHHLYPANERKFSKFPMVGSSSPTSKGFWDVNHSTHSRLQQRPLDLKLPSNQFHRVAYPEKVDLTLRIGGKTTKKDVVNEGFRNHKTNGSSFHHVIDLEDSTDTQYNEEFGSTSTLSSIALVYNQGSQASVQANHISTHSVKDGRESYEEHNSSNQAFKEQRDVIAWNSVPNKMKSSISQKAIGLDLNVSQFDESLSPTDSVTCLSTAGSSCGFEPKVISVFNGAFNSLQQDSGANRTPLGSGNNSSNTLKDMDLLIKSPNKDYTDMTTAEAIEQKNELAEDNDDDDLIQKAAESLLNFSLRSPSIEDQPQRSIDSFEAMALNLSESNLDDDYAVTSKPYEPSEFDKKDCGFKLRRGRRLKDFQKDVLPGLSTLMSYEIREDLQIMQTAIRSREYKRMRSKTVGGGNWFAPVKSKRSRLNYVGRKSIW